MESQRIAGRYLVLRAIGRGGMGVVWLCRDEVLGREVAVKQIGGLPGEPEVETARAMREARSAAALNHPNVVSVYDVVDHDGRPWLVMEYVDGPTLAEILSEEGRLPPLRVADIGARIAGALARAHERGIVHRDVKPGNVLLDRSGRPKISDFGIARGHGDDQLTQTGFFTGTPGYLSPELARGGDPDPKTDVWALGATLYAAVEGQAPYEPRSNPLALLRDIASEPPRPMQHAGGLAPAIAAMMDQDPARRWDMATAAERLGAISRGESLLEDTAAVDTRDHDATRPMTVVVPPEATQRMPAPAAAEPATPPPSAAAGPTPPASVPPGSTAPERRGGRRWLPVALVLLLLVVLGGAFLVTRGSGGTGGTGGATTATSPPSATSEPTPSGSPTPSSSPTTTSTPTTTAPSSTTTPTTTAPTTTPPTSATTSAPAGVPGGDKALASFVQSYFADVTSDRDRTWAQLTPAMQSAAGGRSGYDGFWSSIDRVEVKQTRADAQAKQALVTLTYVRDDGTRSTETHQIDVVAKDGAYLIDSDRQAG
jgi:eukaryotic-like serine/threonine-protein kinase